MRSILATLLICCGILAALSAPAEDKAPPQDKPPRPKTDLGFDATKVPPPDPEKGKPVARVLDQYVYVEQLGPKSPTQDKDTAFRLQMYILGPLLNRFRKQEKIVASPEETEQLESFLKKAKITSSRGLTLFEFYQRETDTDATPGQEVSDAVELWKMERALYRRYGGTIAVHKFRGPEPVVAYRKFLEEAEAAGAIEIYDKEHRTAFYERLTNKPRFVVPLDEVDFEKPWWVRAKEREKSK